MSEEIDQNHSGGNLVDTKPLLETDLHTGPLANGAPPKVLSERNAIAIRNISRGVSEERKKIVKRNKALNDKVQKLEEELAHTRLELESQKKDGLTQTLRKEHGISFLDKILNSENRPPGAVILMDIDKFKDINDTYGHVVGDEVLRAVAKVLSDSLRDTDVLSRYGGEEFMGILTGIEIEQLLQTGNRLRAAVEHLHVTTQKDGKEVRIPITISGGIVPFIKDNTSIEHIDKADKALYGVKENEKQSRNGILMYLEGEDMQYVRPMRFEPMPTYANPED